MEKIELSQDVFVVPDFLTGTECFDYIRESEMRGYEEAKVNIHGQQVMMKNIRDNSRVIFKDQRLADEIFAKIREFCPPEIGNSRLLGLNEMFRFYKYEPGQKFSKHRDGSYKRTATEFSLLTLLIYLNDDFEGGETSFSDFDFKPETGTAMVFNHAVVHQGNAIVKGIKYVLRTDIMYQYKSSQ